jgi:hypothetical protein
VSRWLGVVTSVEEGDRIERVLKLLDDRARGRRGRPPRTTLLGATIIAMIRVEQETGMRFSSDRDGPYAAEITKRLQHATKRVPEPKTLERVLQRADKIRRGNIA